MREQRRSKGDSTNPPTGPGSSIHLGIFVLMLAVTMPRLLRSFSPSWDPLDTSWAWMLGYSIQHHLQWGKSIVFTYGPLGFLTHPYFYSDHRLWGLAATIRLTSWFIFGLGFACILHRLAPADKPLSRTTLPVAIGWVFGASFLHLSAQSSILGVLLLALALAEEDGSAAAVEMILSGTLLAFGALIKSTALIVSLFATLVYPALWWYARRRKSVRLPCLLPLLSFIVSFCVLWSSSSQSFANLAAYLRSTCAIVSGYTPAMSTPTAPFAVLRLQIRSALLILSLFAAVLVGLLVGRRKIRVAQCLLLGGMTFWAWKEGFTLHEPGYYRHPMTFYGTALLIASVGTVLPSGENPWYLKACISGAYAIALLSSLRGFPLLSLSYTRVLDNYVSYATLIASRSHRTAEEQRQVAAIRKQFAVPDGALSAVGNGSVNVVPWSLMLVQGYRMRLIASPVIQSYSAYTPYLDRLNARQIWDGGSADKIIYTYAALGFRYPPFDEPATFQAILTCYRTQYEGNPYSVLSRAPCASSATLSAKGSVVGSFGEWIPIPRQASYAEIAIRSSPIGDIKNILYKANHLRIVFELPDGSVKGPYQFIYPVAADGLYVRYFIGSQSEAAALFSGSASSLQRIAAVKILVTNPGSSDFAQHFGVRFFDENAQLSGQAPATPEAR